MSPRPTTSARFVSVFAIANAVTFCLSPLPVPSPASGRGGVGENLYSYRIFSVASPIKTRISEMIQKRTITRGSGQPFSSK